jgi:hypothetical protein
MRSIGIRFWALGSCALALSLWSNSVSAAKCGSTSAGWNVPAGAAVFTQSPGPIASVLAAVGEYRSHSLLSRGPDSWVTHATSDTPPANGSRRLLGSECSAPVNSSFLYAATPGLETVGQGAIYEYIYGDGVVNFVAYQRGNRDDPNDQIGNDWLAVGMSWAPFTSTQDSGQTVWAHAYNETPVHYGWYQYMNLQDAAQGVPGVNTGIVCSTALALWQHDALGANPGYGGDVLPRRYEPSAIQPAGDALYNAVYSECTGSQPGLFSSFGGFLQNIGTCALCFDCDLCDEAADQVVNCFATNNCGSSKSSIWHQALKNTAALSISPDDIACWNENGTGAPCTGPGSSVWGWDIDETVQWNSGGNQYSCWD